MENDSQERLLLVGETLPTKEAKLKQQQQALRVNLKVFETASDALYNQLEGISGEGFVDENWSTHERRKLGCHAY